jgi:hypothetical protein
MKALILIVCVIGINSCARENTTITPTATGRLGFDSLQAQPLKKGPFVALDGPTTGMATVYRQGNVMYIVLNPFKTHSAPDLKVYLSKDDDAIDYIKVGDLQSTAGKQAYVVPGNPKISDYNYVHIWSEYYTVDFTKADVAIAEIK